MKKYIRLALLILVIITALFCYKKIQLLSKPNIILITLDAARKDHFSCYGYSKNTTPFIDSIAKKGIVFENNFSQDTKTPPSVSSIFFSRYFTLDTIEDDGYIWDIKKEYPWSIFMQFDPGQIFLTKLLSLSGYRTALFSDLSYFHKKAYFTNQFDESFINNKNHESMKLDRAIKINTVIPKIISFIKKNKYQRSFIYWHILSPHGPYPPGVEYKELIGNTDKETIELVRKKYMERTGDSAAIFDENELKCLKGLYDNSLRYADSLVGILYEKLESNKLLDNTMIIITADHGEFLGDHGMITHGNLPWDAVIKVPFILFYPKLINREIRVKEFTESIDIIPTILEICSIKVPAGKSLDGNALLSDKKIPHRIAVFSKDYIRTKKYKYILRENLLYDIEQDPEEKNNIARDQPAVKKELGDLYEQVMKSRRDRYYSKSARNETPDYPFYFETTSMKPEPENAIERYSVPYRKIQEFLTINNPSINKTWLSNTAWESNGIYCLPGKSYQSPITLSAAILNGVYKISMLLKSDHEIDSSIDKFGLRFRFNKNLPFQNPIEMNLFRTSDNNCFYYYFYLGNIAVNDKKFSIDIDFQPQDKKIYIIEHIKFVPMGVKDYLSKEGISVKNKEFKQNIKTLKSLGYL